MNQEGVFDTIETLISAAALCIGCITEETGIPVSDVEITVRALHRTSGVAVVEPCDSCGSARPSFTRRPA